MEKQVLTAIQQDALRNIALYIQMNKGRTFLYAPKCSYNRGHEFVATLNASYCLFRGIFDIKILAKFQDFPDPELRQLIETSECPWRHSVVFADYCFGFGSIVDYVGPEFHSDTDGNFLVAEDFSLKPRALKQEEPERCIRA